MLSKSQISFITSLQQKKFRKQEKLFIAEGEKVVRDLLASSYHVKKIFAAESFLHTQNEYSKNSAVEWIEVTDGELKKISSLTTPNKALAIAEIPSYELDETALKTSLSLVLDDVNDPGNLGTIIRIADWFGIENIICSNETADAYNPKVVQASMGSLFRVQVHYTNLESFLKNVHRSMNVFGTSLDGESIYSSKLSSTGLIVIGSESKGVNKELQKYFSERLFIPSFYTEKKSQTPDSLNVAVAAAIVCAEFRRRVW